MVMKPEGVDITAVQWNWWKDWTNGWGTRVRTGAEHDELRYRVDGGAV